MQLQDELPDLFIEFSEMSPEGMLVYSVDQRRMAYVSAIGGQMTGLRKGSDVQEIEEAFERVIKEDQHYLRMEWAKLTDSDKCEEIEFRILGAENKLYYICASIYVLKRSDFIIVRLSDIAKAKEHENYMLEYGTKKNTILDSVVHFVSGALSLTQHLSSEARKSMETERRHELDNYLSLIHDNSLQCLHVVEDLMKEEHLRSPDIALKRSRADVVERVSFIVERIRNAYRDRVIHFSSSHPRIFLQMDEMKLLQIVNNLLSNALKFSAPQQPVSVTISDLEASVVISVADQGVGIPENLQPFIFDKNSAAKRTGLQGELSNGIGLYICQVLARLMNGRIWFDSGATGSTFYVSLPKS